MPSGRASAGTVDAARGEERGGDVHDDSHLRRRPPGGNPAGQRMIAGTRTPPSHTESLRWKSGALRDSHSPPLSFMKTTSVLRVEPARGQRRQNLPDALVGALEDGHVVRARGGPLVHRLHEAGVVGRHRRTIRHLERPVRGVVRHLEEERRPGVLVDEPHGALGEEIGAVAGRVRRAVVLEEVVLPVAVGVLVVVDQPALEPVEVVEPVGVRAELRLVAEVPLADEAGA